MITSQFDRSLLIWYYVYMKKCKDCGLEFPLTNFYTYRRGVANEQIVYYARCKTCHNKWKSGEVTPEDRRRHRQNHRAATLAKLNELKDNPCVDCGKVYPSYVMDFDHIDPSTKVKNLAKMVGRYKWSDILDEVAKCELVCSNCHRERTHQRKEKF